MKHLLLLLSLIIYPFYISNSQDYVKNTKGNVLISGNFQSNVKAKSANMFLYEIKGNEEYILDSVRVNAGEFTFKNRVFETGVYRIAFNKVSNAIDIVVNPSELTKMHIDISNYRIKKGYNVLNSIENKIKKLYDVKEESINQKIKLIRKTNKSRDEKISEMRNLQNELATYGGSLNKQYPGTYFGMIISKMKSKNTYIPHLYFDDIDFTDQCIVRSSLLPNRIQTYFQNHSNWPDNKYGFHDAIDMIMDYAKVNEEVAEFCMYNMLDGFYNTGQADKKNNPIWGELCDYIMDEYIFGEGCGDDIDPSDLLKERASQFKNLKIGNVPPNFSVLDINGEAVNLKKTCSNNKYTVLMFWASHCQHCMAELPGFANWYNANNNANFEIIGVSLDANKKNWENAINNNNFNWLNICEYKVYKSPICMNYKIKKTPTIFILNHKMEIVAKPRSTQQVRSFLLSNK